MSYKSFWKSEFEKLLCSLSKSNNLLYWSEVSEEFEDYGIPIWEYVYKFESKNNAVSIVIFSSVDKRTDKSRGVGKDAVRVICEWKTRKMV